MLRPTVSRPVWGAQDQIFVSVRQLRVCCCGGPLWREVGSAVYNCCSTSPAQSFSGLSPAGLMTTFHCPRFEAPSTRRARSPYLYPPRKGVAQLYPQALGSLFVASYDSQG
jgi:hypothetical protein